MIVVEIENRHLESSIDLGNIRILMLPPLYPIIDFSCFAVKPDPISAIVRYAEELIAAGATLIQLRDKSLASAATQLTQENSTRRLLSCVRELRRVTW